MPPFPPPLALFQNRTALLATMHRKEEAIAPALQAALGIAVRLPNQFDSDRFGTFTREIDRAGSQIEAARRKAEAVLADTDYDLAIASEGSFGPHPAMPFVPCDREIVLLLDRQHQLEIIGEALSTETNYAQRSVQNLAEALAFAQQVGFPEHGLVVMTPDRKSPIHKGIVTETGLRQAVAEVLSRSDEAQLETDMRALYNPTRMQVIAQATADLIAKIQQTCPSCHAPGFAIGDRRGGLPCAICQWPTALLRSVIYRCQACGHEAEVLYPDGVQAADPGHCAYCNP